MEEKVKEIYHGNQFEVGDRVEYKRIGQDNQIGRIVKITILISIGSDGFRHESITYDIRYPVRELSTDLGYEIRVRESDIIALK